MIADRRRRQRGQILPLLVLTMAAMAVAAMVAITFGQALVRRQQAQMVVDAAAFAGAAEQAKALNTIARLNEKSYSILNGIVLSQKESVYMDDDNTTWGRILVYGISDDWAEENWESFQEAVFDPLNRAIDDINYTYRTYGAPMRAAQRVVEQNFGGEDRLFHGEAAPGAPSEWSVNQEQGPVVWWEDAVKARSETVTLSDATEYAVGGARFYVPYYDNWAVTCDPMYGLNVPCDLAKGGLFLAYVYEAPAIFTLKALLGSHPTYELGRFYENDPSEEVRFTYYLRVPAASPLVAKTFLKAIPSIEVVASAKPYHGQLGAEFISTPSWFPPDPFGGLLWVGQYEQQDSRPIQYGYVAKLTTVSGFEKKQLALWNFDESYFSIMH